MLLNEDINNYEYLKDFYKSFKDYSVFHTKNWSDVIDETYHFHTICIGLFHNKKISSVLPITEIRLPLNYKKGVSLPFSDFYYLLASFDKDYKTLIDEAVRLGKEKKWKYYEYRGGAISGYDYVSYQKFIVHTLDITMDIFNLKQSLKKRAIRNINSARNNGVAVEIKSDISAMKQFYKLHCLTRKRHGLPPQPYRFFKIMNEKIIKNGYGFIALGYWNKEVVAAQLYLNTGSNSTYKYGASNKRGFDLSASYLVMWESIKYLKHSGAQSISLGRTDSTNHGLLQFKDSWGANRDELVYTKVFYKYFRHRKKRIQKCMNLIFMHSPILFLKLVGKIAYRFVG